MAVQELIMAISLCSRHHGLNCTKTGSSSVMCSLCAKVRCNIITARAERCLTDPEDFKCELQLQLQAAFMTSVAVAAMEPRATISKARFHSFFNSI